MACSGYIAPTFTVHGDRASKRAPDQQHRGSARMPIQDPKEKTVGGSNQDGRDCFVGLAVFPESKYICNNALYGREWRCNKHERIFDKRYYTGLGSSSKVDFDHAYKKDKKKYGSEWHAAWLKLLGIKIYFTKTHRGPTRSISHARVLLLISSSRPLRLLSLTVLPACLYPVQVGLDVGVQPTVVLDEQVLHQASDVIVVNVRDCLHHRPVRLVRVVLPVCHGGLEGTWIGVATMFLSLRRSIDVMHKTRDKLGKTILAKNKVYGE